MTLQLIFEELIYELLFNRRADIFPFEMKMLYNEILEKCEVKINYCGEKYNPFEEIDDISITILKGIIQIADYNFDGKNKTKIKFLSF